MPKKGYFGRSQRKSFPVFPESQGRAPAALSPSPRIPRPSRKRLGWKSCGELGGEVMEEEDGGLSLAFPALARSQISPATSFSPREAVSSLCAGKTPAASQLNASGSETGVSRRDRSVPLPPSCPLDSAPRLQGAEGGRMKRGRGSRCSARGIKKKKKKIVASKQMELVFNRGADSGLGCGWAFLLSLGEINPARV